MVVDLSGELLMFDKSNLFAEAMFCKRIWMIGVAVGIWFDEWKGAGLLIYENVRLSRIFVHLLSIVNKKQIMDD